MAKSDQKYATSYTAAEFGEYVKMAEVSGGYRSGMLVISKKELIAALMTSRPTIEPPSSPVSTIVTAIAAAAAALILARK